VVTTGIVNSAPTSTETPLVIQQGLELKEQAKEITQLKVKLSFLYGIMIGFVLGAIVVLVLKRI
jgi:hypothetical protein